MAKTKRLSFHFMSGVNMPVDGRQGIKFALVFHFMSRKRYLPWNRPLLCFSSYFSFSVRDAVALTHVVPISLPCSHLFPSVKWTWFISLSVLVLTLLRIVAASRTQREIERGQGEEEETNARLQSLRLLLLLTHTLIHLHVAFRSLDTPRHEDRFAVYCTPCQMFC